MSEKKQNKIGQKLTKEEKTLDASKFERTESEAPDVEGRERGDWYRTSVYCPICDHLQYLTAFEDERHYYTCGHCGGNYSHVG